MTNTLEPTKFNIRGDCERPHSEECEIPPYCEARVLAWYGCAALESASVADVYYDYSCGGLDRKTALNLLVT